MELSDMTVHVYGDTAVAAGTNTLHGAHKGQDISGKYRFTDTWLKTKWQMASRGHAKYEGSIIVERLLWQRAWR